MTINKRAALLLGTIINSALFIQAAMAQPIDEVIVFSSPFQKPVTKVISTTEVVDADALQTVIDKPIGDALTGLPGVDSASFGPAVGQPLIRGLGGYRIDTLVNSMSVGDIAATGGDHANGLALFDTERIEVLKGPAALRYGAFAATGVINSFNRHMAKNVANRPDDRNDALLAFGDAASETTGAFFVRRDGFALSGFSQDADNLRIPTHAESDLMLAAEGESDEDRAQDAQSTANEGRGFTASAHFENGATDVSLMLSSLERDYGVPGHGHEEGEDEHEGEGEHEAEDDHEEGHEEAEDVSIDLEQQSVHLRLNHAPKNLPIDALRVDLTATDYEQKELEGAAIGVQFEQTSLHLRLEGAFALSGWRSLVGAEFRDAELETAAEGGHGFLPSSERSQVGLFAFAERDNGVWLTELAARMDSVDLEAAHDEEPDDDHADEADDETSYDVSYDVTNLSVGLGRRLNDKLLIGGSLSATERAPSQVELFAEGEHVAAARHETGDPNLAEETALATEFYLRRSWAGGSLRVAVFQNDFDDFIYLARNVDFLDPDEPELQGYDYKQQGAELSGYEIEVRSDFSMAGKTWAGKLSFSEISGELDNGENLPALPPQKIGLGLSTEFGTIGVDFNIDHADEQADTGADELATDGYTSLDISVGWSPAAYEGLRLTAALRNATDEEIRHHTSPLKDLLPKAGRDFRLTARWQF